MNLLLELHLPSKLLVHQVILDYFIELELLCWLPLIPSAWSWHSQIALLNFTKNLLDPMILDTFSVLHLVERKIPWLLIGCSFSTRQRNNKKSRSSINLDNNTGAPTSFFYIQWLLLISLFALFNNLLKCKKPFVL